jgi:RNA polymerase sigma-54 factor
MRLSFGQELHQKQVQQQRQIFSPRQIQSMEILQLPLLALQERIEQELQENAVLELEEIDPDLPLEATEPEPNPDAPTPEEKELVVDPNSDNADDFERLLNLDESWTEEYEERPRLSHGRIEEDSDRKHDAMANMANRPETLHDYLREQLRFFVLEPPVRAMCERIIYSIDDNGRLPLPLEDLLDPTAGPEQLPLAQQALAIVQRLDPPGVAARDLRECLLLQLRPDMPFYEELHKIISNHLPDLEHNRLPVILKKTGYSIELLQQVLEQLRKLNPKPGADFNAEPAPPVTPDINVERDENGRYVVRMDESSTPRLHISAYYRKLLQDGHSTPEAKEYIKRKINAAQWLMEAIEQRRNTLRKVAQAIVDHQTAFLEKGPEYIEPLKMQQIADKVGVHVTTVSRAVDDKWMQTPRGIFPLRRFFGGGTVTAAGEEVAWDAVRLKLQEVIDHEDKRNPFSDDDLVRELAKHGLAVARRTVTKYRKAMNIPSSRQRRDWTLAAGNGRPGVTHAPAPAEAANPAGGGTGGDSLV